MPLVRVELFERRLTPELESRLIERLTETLLECLEAPELKEHTWVIVEGHDAHRWGRACARPTGHLPAKEAWGADRRTQPQACRRTTTPCALRGNGHSPSERRAPTR
jgi:phenylpyruvate tautomerase PptA (4-oxalocrotonate tautomerase family)